MGNTKMLTRLNGCIETLDQMMNCDGWLTCGHIDLKTGIITWENGLQEKMELKVQSTRWEPIYGSRYFSTMG